MVAVTPRVNDIRETFIELYTHHANTHVEMPPTIEIIGASFQADEPAIFGKPNDDYINRELAWYMSQSLFVDDIPGETPKIWRDVADKNGFINSNYGYLIFSADNGLQYYNVLRTLMTFPEGRRGTMIYTRPTMHSDWNIDGMSDFICTNAVSFFIRGQRVFAVVQMRSSDVVFGYRNDYAWHAWVQSRLVSDLNDSGMDVTVGPIIWQAASLHIYKRHYKLIEEKIK